MPLISLLMPVPHFYILYYMYSGCFKDLWTFHPTDISPHGHFAPWKDILPHGRLAPQTIRPTDDVNINNQQRPGF